MSRAIVADEFTKGQTPQPVTHLKEAFSTKG